VTIVFLRPGYFVKFAVIFEMCKSPLHPLIHSLPKVEHHIHLEGALEPHLFFELAGRNDVKLPTDDTAFTSEEALLQRYQNFTSLDDFLHYYYIGMSVLVSVADFEALATHYFQRSSADGVKHAEVFFDPQAHLSRGIAYSTVLQGFLTAKLKAEQNLGMSIHIIVCFLRHLPISDSLAVFDQHEVQASFTEGHVIGIGIDSSETDFPPHLFTDLYKKAKALNLRRTAHAGEEGPATYIAGALDDLGVERIDHGVRLATSPDIMTRVVNEGVLLTLCPTSNVLLRCVNTIKDVPIREFLDKGVKFSINSDDPAYFRAYILDNYCAIQEAFDLNIDEWKVICVNGIQSSWCAQERKAELLQDLDNVITRWKEAEA
jgi:adenosine deaminase